MPLYQIYLSGSDGRIVGRREIDQATDHAALATAQHHLMIGMEAELWHDTRRVGLVKSLRTQLDQLEVARL